MEAKLIPVLAVALITWGGVLAYMIRVTSLLKSLESDVQSLDMRDDSPR